MRGEFAGVKSEIIKDIFEPLMDEMTDEEFSEGLLSTPKVSGLTRVTVVQEMDGHL
jgi:hypothetical protein